MDACTFFGHRDAPKEIAPILRSAILSLIENHSIRLFYVGNHGSFDAMVRRQLSEMEKTHGIRYYIVLAYLPKKGQQSTDDPHTLFPENMETDPPRFAISKRNRWMLDHSQCVITYVQSEFGGAAQFKQRAQKAGKTVIELGDI